MFKRSSFYQAVAQILQTEEEQMLNSDWPFIGNWIAMLQLLIIATNAVSQTEKNGRRLFLHLKKKNK